MSPRWLGWCGAALSPLAVAVVLQAQSLSPRFQDGETVEVWRDGQPRRAIVRGYAAWGEYQVEYEDTPSVMNRDWVTADQVRAVAAAPTVRGNAPLDLAPLYQSIGAACGGLGCCGLPLALTVLIAVRSGFRRRSSSNPPPPPPA
jgi:hypothetical protein